MNFLFSEIDCVYVKSLERCHAQIVYDYWPYRESTTVENITREIELLPSAGVFLKGNDQLVSWMMCHPPNGMSRLHTLEEHRRRGYAALVTQYLSQRVAQCGFVPFANNVIENTASYKFFESMKFKHLPSNARTV
jgi:predicted GNAT family acetyltransferase